MTSPAPYCPDTIGRIRAASGQATDVQIARDLNWTPQRVRSVALAHQITLTIAVHAAPSPSASLGAPIAVGDIVWVPAARSVMRGKKTAILSERDARVFSLMLLRFRDCPGEWMRGPRIAEETKIDYDQIAFVKSGINYGIEPLNLLMEGRRSGGYRLVDLLAQEKKEAAE